MRISGAKHRVSTIKIILLFAGFSLMIPIGNAYSTAFTDSLDISGEDTDPQGLAFNTDGTKMFVLAKASSSVFHHVSEYACTTGFDISTCTFSVGESLSVAAQEPFPTGIAFSTDGLSMYITGDDGNDVTEFTCGPAAFDVSTCGVPIDAKSTGEDTTPQDLAFNTDGTKMFVIGQTGNVVNEYACTTGFDVSTCSFTVKAGNPFSVAAQETAPTGIAFSTDGLTMFIVGNGIDAVENAVATVNEYALGTAFDISTSDSPEPDTTPPDYPVPADVIEDVCGKSADSFNVIIGTAGNDKIKGTNAADLIFGLGGNDSIKGKRGDDCIFGGDGKDRIKGGKGNDTIDGGDGNDRIYGNRGDDTISGGDGNDRIRGGSGNDSIDGGAGDDVLRGHKGNDTIDGGDGNDRIHGGSGNDSIDGGAGNDKIYGNRGDDTISGGDGKDKIKGGKGDDTIDGGAGNDKINGNKGTDTCIPDPADTVPPVNCEL